MIYKKCPGTDPRYLKIELKKCPYCGYEIEFFSDEIKVKCPKCNKDVFRGEVPSCITWCKYAAECIGKEKWEQIKVYIEQKQQQVDIKERLLAEMRLYFGSDINNIVYTEKVLRYAEEILKQEPSSDRNIVVSAAILHRVGLKKGQQGQNETVNIAKQILQKLGVKQQQVENVLKTILLSNRYDNSMDINSKILHDAIKLVELKEENNLKKLKENFDKIFLTETAKNLAEKVCL